MRLSQYSYPPRHTRDSCDIGLVMRVATLSEMLEEVVRLGEATGMEEHAHELRGELEERLAAIRAAVSEAPAPRVVALERLDPPRAAGYWIPEMISIAGGVDVAGDPGLQPPEVGWGELASLGPEVVVVMPGGSLADGRAQAMEHWERIAALGAPASSPSTPTPPSASPARAWSTASSCSPTCCTRRWSHRRAARLEALRAPVPRG